MRKLSAKFIERHRTPGRYSDGEVKGLKLQITASASGVVSKSWLFKYQVGDKETMLGLGSLKDVTWKEAREKARAMRLLLLDGVDPLQAKRERIAAAKATAASVKTFRQCAELYEQQHEVRWRSDSHRRQFGSSLASYAYPIIGSTDVSKIDLTAVLRCIEPQWTTKAVTMDRVRTRIEAVLDWATVRGYRQGDNPARWRGHLDQVLPAPRQVAPIKHHAAMDYKDLPAFMQTLRQQEEIAARALEFTILSAGRLGEVIGAKWNEIHFDDPVFGPVWIVPAQRMKARREHRVPLSPQAVKLLRALPREDGNDHLFVGSTQGSSLSKMSIQYLIRRIHSTATTHGMRAAFRTWAGEMTNFPREACELALAHRVGDQTEQAYARGTLLAKRIKLMQAWATYCLTPPIAKAGNVVPMRG